MMKLRVHSLSRRRFLRAAGVVLPLPLLEVMRAEAAPSQWKPWKASTLARPPGRAIFCYVPNGKNIAEWMPEGQGAGYKPGKTLAVLQPHRADFTVISGLSHPNAEGGHTGADVWLTGARLKGKAGSEYSNSISIDQVIAEQIGTTTRYPSLQLSDLSGTGIPGHSHTLSFDRVGTPLPAEDSPHRLFARLFASEAPGEKGAALKRYAERRSILDSVLGDAKGLAGQLSATDRAKLDEYMTSVRATEARVRRLEGWAGKPKADVPRTALQLESKSNDAHDRSMWIDVMLELAYLSFITDTTRVITFEWSREAAGFGGNGENHHEYSHHGGDPGMLAKLGVIDRFHVGRLGRFLDSLKATSEGDGTMLDRTIVVYGSGMNSGAGGEHSPKNLPLLVAGGRKLGLKHGQHLGFDPARNPPLSNVLVTVAERVGAKVKGFQDATGALSGLV